MSAFDALPLSQVRARHKLTITTATLIASAMISGTGISIWQATRAVDERNKKEAALTAALEARTEADEARKQVEQFAEQLKQANVLLASARTHADAGRWSAANFDYTRAAELQPRYYLVWIERASLYARLGLWERAAADYARAVDLNAPVDGPGWWGVPHLLWYTGDEQRQREVCQRILMSADASSDGLSVFAIRNCLLTDLPEADPAAWAQTCELLLSADGRRRRDDRGFDGRPGPPPPPWSDRGPLELPGSFPVAMRPRERGGPPRGFGFPFGASLYVTGWAQYRAGNYGRAIELLQRSCTEDPDWPGQGIGYPVLAMACQRAGQFDQAREALAAATHRIDAWTAELTQQPLGRLPLPWFDWIECLALDRQAALLIHGHAPPEDQRLARYAQRATAAIEQGTN